MAARCGQSAGIELIDASENARRWQCALQARRTQVLMVIGRTDALPAVGMAKALGRARRCQRYLRRSGHC